MLPESAPQPNSNRIPDGTPGRLDEPSVDPVGPGMISAFLLAARRMAAARDSKAGQYRGFSRVVRANKDIEVTQRDRLNFLKALNLMNSTRVNRVASV